MAIQMRDPYRSELARSLIAQGVNPGPIQHPTQTLGALAQALVGSLMLKKENQAAKSQREALARALGADPRIANDPVLQDLVQDPQFQGPIAGALVQSRFGQPGEGFTLSPGESRFDAAGNTIATVPEKQEVGPKFRAPTPDELLKFNLPPNAPIKVNDATGEVEVITGVDALTPDTADNLKTETGLRKEFTGLTKDFRTVRDAYGRVQASADDPSAAGDLSMIFNFMKVLDPNSVVRESEFATAENAGSVPERIRAQYNKVLEGERLSTEQRADFLNRTNRLYQSQLSIYNQTAESYRELANSYGVDADRVVLELAKPPEAQNPNANSATNPASPQSEQDFASLPSGAFFIDPESGELRRKQ